ACKLQSPHSPRCFLRLERHTATNVTVLLLQRNEWRSAPYRRLFSSVRNLMAPLKVTILFSSQSHPYILFLYCTLSLPSLPSFIPYVFCENKKRRKGFPFLRPYSFFFR